MDNNNNKETLYTFKFTQSQLEKIKITLDNTIASLDSENINYEDEESIIELNNIFSKRLNKIKKKLLNK
tara:strand:+ start:1794 stop:2000 length:207 start_codon:yes stop_codon:yes gene_type:complete